MAGFLGEVAAQLLNRWGEGISDVTLIFPSRRARLFFMDELQKGATKPMWQPPMTSLDDLIGDISQMCRGERIRLISELYKIYSKHHEESFDGFYFWGEVLLSDFDMVDKYLVDAEKLFTNVKDIKELEADISYLTEEQRKILSFWTSIGDGGDNISYEKDKFLTIWRSLAPIYKEYRERLEELGLAYSGMMQRRAVERISSGEFSFDGDKKYALIGFNALSECEKRIFSAMQSAGVADFFWDKDDYYMVDDTQEAGLFLRDNSLRFPQRLATSCDNFLREKDFTAVSTASSALQCKYAAKIIESLASSGGVDKDTAIILTDENLLQPLLYSLPESCSKVNVTMGYPIRASLAYSFIERLLELQGHARRSQRGDVSFYHIDVVGILTHPFIELVAVDSAREVVKTIERERLISVDAALFKQCDALATIFSYAESWEMQSQHIQRVIELLVKACGDDTLQRQSIEFLSYMHNHIVEMENSVRECFISLSMSVYTSLLRKQLQMLRIPFEGEPLEGLQVMGILESRNLDFKNVIILSMNDDNFPGNRLMQPSYIPYSLRVGYSLPTPEQHEGVYAYYFYRLVQRAEKVWMLYCSRADEKSTGEQSRYIRQVDYEAPFNVNRVEVSFDINFEQSAEVTVEKRGEVAEQLREFISTDTTPALRRLSPTVLCRYIACPMRFYLHSLARIRTSDDMSEDVDAPMFGLIIHSAMEHLYSSLNQAPSMDSGLRSLLEGETITDAIDIAIDKEFYRGRKVAHSEESGDLILVRDVVARYLRTVIQYDIANPPERIHSLEKPIDFTIPLSSGRSVVLAGLSDRVDILPNGLMRVIDYKTGSPHLEFTSLEALFTGEARERLSNTIQTLLYSVMLQAAYNTDVVPALYYVRAMNKPDYSPLLIDKSRKSSIAAISTYREEFMEWVNTSLEELFNEDIPFTQCSDAKTCLYCDYRTICER